MIIVINSQGGVVSIQEEDLFQGSTGLNIINLVAPFSDGVTFKAMFEMPDGTYKPDNLDGYIMKPSIALSKDLNVWKMPILFPVTQDYGLVNMQIRGMVGNKTICTTTVKLSIQKGVPYASDFEELSDKDQLLQMIADLRARLSGKVDNVNYVYQEVEVTAETSGTYYVYNDELDIYEPKLLPQDYQEGVIYFEVASTGRVINNDDGLFIEYVDNLSGQSMRLDIKGDKATLNDKEIATKDDIKDLPMPYEFTVVRGILYEHLEHDGVALNYDDIVELITGHKKDLYIRFEYDVNEIAEYRLRSYDTTSGNIYFNGFEYAGRLGIIEVRKGNYESYGYRTIYSGTNFERTINRSSIIYDDVTQTFYPTTKAVYDFVMLQTEDIEQLQQDVENINTDINNINELIPEQATTDNKLADKAFVNSTVQTNTANFRGNWTNWTNVPTNIEDYPEDYAGNHKPTVNDYMVVQNASDYEEETLVGTWRFKYTGNWDEVGVNGWRPEYQVNETPLTAAQLAALNSGITSGAVGQITTNQNNIETLSDGLQETDNKVTTLENDVDELKVLKLDANPTTETVGKVGQFALNVTSSALFQCVSVDEEGGVYTYTWRAVGGGSVAVDNTTISKNRDNELQAIGLTDGNNGLTFEEIYQAMTIERTVS